MPRFTISALDASGPVSEVIANDPGSVLAIMLRMNCRNADVARDGDYLFSARLDGNEVWSIFDRSGRHCGLPMTPSAVPAPPVSAKSL